LKKCKDIVPDHIDNDGLNNFYKNLRWLTRGENVSEAFKNGYINNSGINHRDVFITDKEAHKICKYLENGLSYDAIIQNMNFPNNKKYRTLLVRIKNGLAWKEVYCKYNISKSDIKYTSKQLDTLNRIPKILQMKNDGYNTTEIFKEVYKGKKCNVKTKMNIIRKICKEEIFKNEISKFKKKIRAQRSGKAR
jgi:hypothetical protein